MRLSPEVVQHFKDQGPGWQTRIDPARKQYMHEHESPGSPVVEIALEQRQKVSSTV
ncbi:BrnA antitoxin family protein [Kushneria aurantia]|uniref:BrnA antitoxin family protein n=1 Tax=Kushneria aurantia TaxID=504092 RepID=A0ABV6G3T3_9GAMM|nr:BrnA antitoxin family protein [Kushneria aurantia]